MSDETRVNGVRTSQTLQFDLLDEETREAVVKCIQEKCKFTVVIGSTGEVTPLGGEDWAQSID